VVMQNTPRHDVMVVFFLDGDYGIVWDRVHRTIPRYVPGQISGSPHASPVRPRALGTCR
jgi:hypothetical protein